VNTYNKSCKLSLVWAVVVFSLSCQTDGEQDTRQPVLRDSTPLGQADVKFTYVSSKWRQVPPGVMSIFAETSSEELAQAGLDELCNADGFEVNLLPTLSPNEIQNPFSKSSRQSDEQLIEIGLMALCQHFLDGHLYTTERIP
jgi:hypothetical protein